MAFTAQDVKDLREKTGCGMMDCKKALTASDGDVEKAIEFLREKGLAAAAKKSGRVAAEGVVCTMVDYEKKVGVVIEVNSETDFVGKNADFISFVEACAKTVIDENPADVEALMNCKLAGTDVTVDAALKDKILTIGENLKIRRFTRYEGNVVSYTHGGGRIGVLVKFELDGVAADKDFETFGKDIAMQIAAVSPSYICPMCVPADVVAKEKEIVLAQIENDPKLAGKPAQVKEKMVDGRINKFYKEVCLLKQPFVKDGEIDVAEYIEKTGKGLGGTIKVADSVRYEKGEGIEKREDDFAAEVASMVK